MQFLVIAVLCGCLLCLVDGCALSICLLFCLLPGAFGLCLRICVWLFCISVFCLVIVYLRGCWFFSGGCVMVWWLCRFVCCLVCLLVGFGCCCGFCLLFMCLLMSLLGRIVLALWLLW